MEHLRAGELDGRVLGDGGEDSVEGVTCAAEELRARVEGTSAET